MAKFNSPIVLCCLLFGCSFSGGIGLGQDTVRVSSTDDIPQGTFFREVAESDGSVSYEYSQTAAKKAAANRGVSRFRGLAALENPRNPFFTLLNLSDEQNIGRLFLLELSQDQKSKLEEIRKQYLEKKDGLSNAARQQMIKDLANQIRDILLDEQLKTLAKIAGSRDVFNVLVSENGREFFQLSQKQADLIRSKCEVVNRKVEIELKRIKEIEDQLRNETRSILSVLSPNQLDQLKKMSGVKKNFFETDSLRSLRERTDLR